MSVGHVWLMRRKAVIAAMVLAGCSGPASAVDVNGEAPWSGEGVLLVSGEEMHLFGNATEVGQFPGHCTTIVPRSMEDLKLFRAFNRKPVRVRGNAVAWPSDTHSISVNGIRVLNACFSSEIVFAIDIAPSATRAP